MIVLGINAYHGDSSACLLEDGKLVAAAEEERFRRIKHWAGFPSESIRYCLRAAGIGLPAVDHVAINQDSTANLSRKLAYAVRARPELGMLVSRLRHKRERATIPAQLESCFAAPFRGQLHRIEHHLAHLGSAFLVSPFDEAVAVSVDGFGDFASAGWGVGRGGSVAVEDRVYFPHSLGIFYEAITRHLGFHHYGDEYKVMGLAPYGQARYLPEMRRIVRTRADGKFELDLQFFRHHREKVEFEWDNGEPKIGELASPALAELLGPARGPGESLDERHKDIARSAQAMYEEAFFNLLRHLHERHRLDALALAGGCAMNSVANGRIYRNTPFRKLYVQSAAGDAGGAIGAAVIAWEGLRVASGGRRRESMDHAYWGPEFGRAEIRASLDKRAADLGDKCSIREIGDEDELCRATAAAVAAGAVVGWFQGRMEWGPRALGNRSIVCDPRRADMKDILNVKIKRRESFRPFAPSVMREAVPDWFELDDDVPFMMQVFPIRQERRALIPAVTHVDGSGRLQTVTRETNPRYYRLIEAFHSITGVPMVLNTSFNENEPVVCTPDEALDCFLRTRMDLLVLGDHFLSRSASCCPGA